MKEKERATEARCQFPYDESTLEENQTDTPITMVPV